VICNERTNLIDAHVVRDDLALGLLTLTRLPNSLGLLAFPLRMISVCG